MPTTFTPDRRSREIRRLWLIGISRKRMHAAQRQAERARIRALRAAVRERWALPRASGPDDVARVLSHSDRSVTERYYARRTRDQEN